MSTNYGPAKRGTRSPADKLQVSTNHAAAVRAAIEATKSGDGSFPTVGPVTDLPDWPNVPPRATPLPSSVKARR